MYDCDSIILLLIFNSLYAIKEEGLEDNKEMRKSLPSTDSLLVCYYSVLLPFCRRGGRE